jgi:hypothetical protein
MAGQDVRRGLDRLERLRIRHVGSRAAVDRRSQPLEGRPVAEDVDVDPNRRRLVDPDGIEPDRRLPEVRIGAACVARDDVTDLDPALDDGAGDPLEVRRARDRSDVRDRAARGEQGGDRDRDREDEARGSWRMDQRA